MFCKITTQVQSFVNHVPIRQHVQTMFQVVRLVQKFMRKYYAAQLLAARLFQTEQDVDELKAEIVAAQLYQANDTKLMELMKLSTGKLQQWVRGSFVHDGQASSIQRKFLCTVVKPALAVCVANLPEQLVSVMGKFLAIVSGTEATSVDAANIRIACSALSGELSAHPLIQGLCLQARRQVEKKRRGLESMVGRRSKETQREADLIADAGIVLAMHASNVSLAREFGLSATTLKIDLNILAEKSLPSAALAACWPNVLQENWALVDQRFTRHEKSSRCGLDMLGSLMTQLFFDFVS